MILRYSEKCRVKIFIKELHNLKINIFFCSGVFFRKHTAKKAIELRLNGWCMNTACGSVKGFIEGPEREINEM